jgi:uracil-DNA glycosylase
MSPSGPILADILIITEAPSQEALGNNEVYSDRVGRLFKAVLSRVGILSTSCFITTVCKVPPPFEGVAEWYSDRKTSPGPEWVFHPESKKWLAPQIHSELARLSQEITEVQPRLIIALGNLPLFLLTGNSGINNWRGSRLTPVSYTHLTLPTM